MNALPKLAITPASPYPGDSVQFDFTRSETDAGDAQLFVAFFNGIAVQYADLGADNKVTVPQGLQGTVYAAIVKTKDDISNVQKLLTGLVMFEINFPSYVGNP